eukprot:UN30932
MHTFNINILRIVRLLGVWCLLKMDLFQLRKMDSGIYIKSNDEEMIVSVRNGRFKESIPDTLGSGWARAMSYDDDSFQLYVGTRRNQIINLEVKEKDTPEESDDLKGTVLLHGHASEIWGLAMHPSKNEYATAAYDGVINVWDIDQNRSVKRIALAKIDYKENRTKDEEIACATWSNNGKYIAVGTESSKVFIVNYESGKVVTTINIKRN